MGSAGGAGAAGASDRTCQSGELDPETQLERCANGISHRPHAPECLRFPGVTTPGVGNASSDSQCEVDADCAENYPPGSVCVPGAVRHWAARSCATPCTTDGDCDSGEACFCDGSEHGGVCHEVSCKTDADCGLDALCVLAPTGWFCGQATYSCLGVGTECFADSECDAGDVCEFGKCTPNEGICE